MICKPLLGTLRAPRSPIGDLCESPLTRLGCADPPSPEGERLSFAVKAHERGEGYAVRMLGSAFRQAQLCPLPWRERAPAARRVGEGAFAEVSNGRGEEAPSNSGVASALVHQSERRLQPEFGKIDAKQRIMARARDK